ncbi:MAG: hypothetical protein DI611_12235 [Brachybacterium faecium]|nr:MAG: hypothetical protein DI611_12235 [Brachybacterium faecium]
MNRFKEALAGSHVIFIVGTGFSAFTSEGASTATWSGLIKSGADRALSLNPELGPKWMSAVDQLLQLENTSYMVQAASIVARAMKDIGETAYAHWLENDIGQLEIRNDSVAKAILAYPFPILTTNYDTLLEQVGGRSSADWTSTREFHNVVSRSSTAIGHLHGVWDNPSSVILTEADYERIKTHESTQALERAVSALNSVVYIGFGSGLSDPNFSELTDWRRRLFPTSGAMHFRLCRADEESQLRRDHASDNITPIVYGRRYEDLSAFLLEHAPDRSRLVINEAGLARDVIQETRDRLRNSMSSESVLLDAGSQGNSNQDFIVPPVFLPMPHESFVREKLRQDAEIEVEQLDGYDEVKSHDFFVVVGDEGSGLSTAIKWLATESSEILGSAAPLFVRYSDCRIRRSPLNYAVIDAAMIEGLIRSRDESLPDHILALDDFNPTIKRISDSVLTQLVSSQAIVKIIGCPQGHEDALVGRLREFGVSPRILFLGRMRKRDIVALAEKFAPRQGQKLARDAIRMLDSEGLRRTPLTVSLLIYLLLRGNSREVISQTSMIDAYLSLLLMGVGDPHDDETGLTETDLQAVLAHLAEYMVWQKKPGLLEHDAVQQISGVLERYSWGTSTSAQSVLQFLLRRRVLRIHGSKVEFSRYSYLTLFAARRAMVDEEFHELIVNDIFYYAPIAKRLAALTRTDTRLFAELRPLLEEELADESVPGSPYELVKSTKVSEEPEGEMEADDLVTADPELDEEIEFPESNSPGNFGLIKSDMSSAQRISRSARLVSSVLRDLDQVESLDEKRDLFVMALELWGRFITALSTDPLLKDLENAIARDFPVESGANKDDDSQWRDFLIRSIPAASALSGMEFTLVSPKLVATLDSALSRGEMIVSSERITGALFFLFLGQPPGWAKKAKALIESSEQTWVIAHFFHALCEHAYKHGGIPERGLMELCKTLLQRKTEYRSPQLKSAHMNAYAQRLRSSRAQYGRGAAS